MSMKLLEKEKMNLLHNSLKCSLIFPNLEDEILFKEGRVCNTRILKLFEIKKSQMMFVFVKNNKLYFSLTLFFQPGPVLPSFPPFLSLLLNSRSAQQQSWPNLSLRPNWPPSSPSHRQVGPTCRACLPPPAPRLPHCLERRRPSPFALAAPLSWPLAFPFPPLRLAFSAQ